MIASVANLILEHKIESFEGLNDQNFVEMIRAALPIKGGFALNTKLMMTVLNELGSVKKEKDTAESGHVIEHSPYGGVDAQVHTVSILSSNGLFAHEVLDNSTQEEKVERLTLSNQ